MISTNYYFKGKNFLRFRRTFWRWTLALSITILLFLSVFMGSGQALDWAENDWSEMGCPKNILGTWLSQDQTEQLAINKNQIISRSISGEETFFTFKGNTRASDNRFIKLVMNPIDSDVDSPIYLKIRPHLAFTQQNPTSSNCFIKIFCFDSQKDARLDKYMSWKIYKRRN